MRTPVMLTTIDNPFNPFAQFDEWYAYDTQKGYFTCNFLARIAKTSVELPENLNEIEVERAIDEICELNVLGIYAKIGPNGQVIPPMDAEK